MQQASTVPESFDHRVVYFLLVTFTVAGFFAVALYITHFLRLMLSLFVLPGKSVCSVVSSTGLCIC